MALLVKSLIVLAPGIYFAWCWTEQVKSDRKVNARDIESRLPYKNNSRLVGHITISYLVLAVGVIVMMAAFPGT